MLRYQTFCWLLSGQGIKKAQIRTIIIEITTVRRNTVVRTYDTNEDVALSFDSSPLVAAKPSCLLSTCRCWTRFEISSTSESASFVVSVVPFPFWSPLCWMLMTRSSSLSSLSACVSGSYSRRSWDFFPIEWERSWLLQTIQQLTPKII